MRAEWFGLSADEILIVRIKLNEVWLTALAGVKNPSHPEISVSSCVENLSHFPQPITIAKFVTLLDM
jgi:hypothetical protein